MHEELTACELIVMKVIWRKGEEMSIQDIVADISQIYQKDWKTQTVSTFLSRIVKKGYLSMKRQGRYFFYSPLINEEEYGKKEIVKCVDFWGEGKIDALVAAFADTRSLTEEEKKNIRSLLDDMD